MASSTTLNDFSKPNITLNSPVNAKPAIYSWPLTYVSKGQKIDGAEEIIETIRWVSREYVEFKAAIEGMLREQPDYRDYDSIKDLCDRYNKVTDYVKKMNKGTSIALNTSSRASQGLLKHILQQVYNYSVDEPNELNKYSPFSSETYGETSFEFMAQLIDKEQFKPREQDTFIDLGSGVGHLVLQMAAMVECKKCYGIEIADRPAGFARKMEERFKFWMDWHGKIYTEFEIFHGDFFDKRYDEIIRTSNYIFVNNYAFKPDDDHKLKQKFLDLKDGTQILSSKPFCSPKNRVSERHLTDLGSIMQVIIIQPEQKKDSVSWTPKPLPYYLHVLDSSKLQKYYERQKRRSGKQSTEKGKPNKRRKTIRGSDSCTEDSDDQQVFGPTTRKAWSEWCNASSLNVSNRTSTDSSKTVVSSRNSSTDIESNIGTPINEDEEEEEHQQEQQKTTTHNQTNTNSILLKGVKHQTHSAANNNNNNNNNKQTKELAASLTTSTSKARNDKVKNSGTTSASNSNRQQDSASNQDKIAQQKGGQNTNGNQTPKSCLDKKRDYAIKKNGNSSIGATSLQNAPASALYSISKPSDAADGSSPSKIPNIVIKVKASAGGKQVAEKITSRSSSFTAESTDNSPVVEPTTKKLRQRKKSAQSDDTNTTSSTAAASASKTSGATLSKISENKRESSKSGTPASVTKAPQKAPSTRAKKAPAASVSNNGPTSTQSRSALKSNSSSNKKSNVSPYKSNSLELLHAKTVESVTSNTGLNNQPAPGCENYSLSSIRETPSLPKVVIKDVNMYVNSVKNSKTIDRFVEQARIDISKFLSCIQQPNYKEILMKSIEHEKARQRELIKTEDSLIKMNRHLADRMTRAMKVHCDDLGIHNNNRSIIQHLSYQLKKNQDLQGYVNQLETMILNHTRPINPPPAHSNIPGPTAFMAYRDSNPPSTLDLSLKQTA